MALYILMVTIISRMKHYFITLTLRNIINSNHECVKWLSTIKPEMFQRTPSFSTHSPNMLTFIRLDTDQYVLSK